MTSVIQGMTITGNLSTDVDGNIVHSGGTLENDEKVGNTLYTMLSCIPALTNALGGTSNFNKITLTYPDSVLMATASSDKVHVVKFQK